MRHRIIIAVLIFWAFINLLFLAWAYFGRKALPNYGVPGYFKKLGYDDFKMAANYLYPTQTDNYKAYDITEFMLYVMTPFVLFFLYRYVKGEDEPLLP